MTAQPQVREPTSLPGRRVLPSYRRGPKEETEHPPAVHPESCHSHHDHNADSSHDEDPTGSDHDEPAAIDTDGEFEVCREYHDNDSGSNEDADGEYEVDEDYDDEDYDRPAKRSRTSSSSVTGRALSECKRCRKTFVRPGDLRRHADTSACMNGEKKHLCTNCGKRLSRHDALLRHHRKCRPRPPVDLEEALPGGSVRRAALGRPRRRPA
ncbi:uncharacterized protein B0H18DRAFT_503488 [Fomitopsis serialis]|uniref:uncharacterized protein n=1 Tax=Fomitopsis serialis TaxID=139415 RepID=UPI002008A64F|nr:uncharacterized protein B0H18DRAFT_503488 [Neoantrodia serialis]KAH9922752.1 hypothetical protein B0H18DRAFT_503488 [Neoantrodia serialis]